MTLGSLFDGIGGWQLAAVRAGIKPVWSSEIDKFCCEVTRRHFPDTIQLGDINSIHDAPKVDIITAGSPCQNLSVAGNRSGIHGDKSKLFFKATELVRRLQPKFFVWENVQNVLSSNGGLDFKAVLEEILQESIPLPKHGWSYAGLVDGRICQIAWRLLDAQYWGIPQRRKRIFLVADFTTRRAVQILFEFKGLQGNSAQSKGEEYQSAARNCKRADFSIFDMTHANEVLRPVHGDKVNCLNARMGTGGNQVPVVFGIGRDAFNQGKNAKFKPTIEQNLQPPLTARGASAVATNKIIRRLTPTECERLQGLPDDWTAGSYDSKRYKAIGNGMAQPCADFILRRLNYEDNGRTD